MRRGVRAGQRRGRRGAGIAERAFHAPPDVMFSVGVHHFTGAPQPLAAQGDLFRFLV